VADLKAPALVNVTPETASLFFNPVAVNSVPANITVSPKHFILLVAVMVKDACVIVRAVAFAAACINV